MDILNLNINAIISEIDRQCIASRGGYVRFTRNWRCSVSVKYVEKFLVGWCLDELSKGKMKKYEKERKSFEDTFSGLPDGLSFVREVNVLRDDRNDSVRKEFRGYYTEETVYTIKVSDSYSRKIFERYSGQVERAVAEYGVVDEDSGISYLNKAIDFQNIVLSKYSDKITEVLRNIRANNGITVYSDYVSGTHDTCCMFKIIEMKPLNENYMIYGFARAIAVFLNNSDKRLKYSVRMDKSGRYCVVSLLNTTPAPVLRDWI